MVVPLNVRLVVADYLHMLTDSGSRVLVTTGEFIDRMPELARVPGLTVVRADTGGWTSSPRGPTRRPGRPRRPGRTPRA